MVALKEAEQDEGILAFTYQLIDYRVRCHHSATATNEVPTVLFIAPSRLGRGDNDFIRKRWLAIHVPGPHHVE
jgi:hypothetical protein